MSNDQLTNDQIHEFVIAGHGNLSKVETMLAEQPALLNVAYEWSPGDFETALQGAAHVGSRPVAEYLLAQGAPLDICTAAMFGRRDAVEEFVQRDPAAIQSKGTHGIPLLAHAALSGDVSLVATLYAGGATTGASFATNLAVSRGDANMTRWLLENASPDLSMKNFQGESMLEVATNNGNAQIVELLREHGATA